MGSVLLQKLLFFVGVLCFSVSVYVLLLIDLITRYLLSYKTVKNANYWKDTTGDNPEENNVTEPKPEESELVLETDESNNIVSEDEENYEFYEDEIDQHCLQFKFPTYQEFDKNKGENELDDPLIFNKCEFTQSESTSHSGFMELNSDSRDVSLDLEEDSSSDSRIEGLLSGKDLDLDLDLNPVSLEDKEEERSDDRFLSFEDFEKITPNDEEFTKEMEESITEEKLLQHADKISFEDRDNTIVEVPEMGFSDFDSETETSSSNHMRSVISSFLDSGSDDGFLSDGDFGGEFDSFTDINHEKEQEHDQMIRENHESEEQDELQSSNFLSEKDFQADFKTVDGEDFGNSEPIKSKNKEPEDSNKLESLWEHQELIEQLKMELRKVRATGLPTILEESESPRISEDLKPWKIDEKFQHEDYMGELHKFYKSYRERMRKLDILNYQKMYAIGFLQFKDPFQSISGQKPSFPAMKSLIPHNFAMGKRKVHGSDPMIKFMKELQSDLEVIYVGQLCLSWEILHWQYEKALDLWEADPRGIHRYNEVAGEFQQFQVLMQRFIEDEPFQGPRVQIYVKNRCVLRNLLQVPLIREDNSKEKMKIKTKERGDYAISGDSLVEIMEESIRIFWRFLRYDRDCNTGNIKLQKGSSLQLQESADTELQMQVVKDLQKKERKLKDLVRSGNCILKKFRRCNREDDSDQVLYFFSQVDMKLVSRVLNMPRLTTDQLIWCRNKLSKISFVNRKINVEPSFLLFPC